MPPVAKGTDARPGLSVPRLIWAGTLATCLALACYLAWLVARSYEGGLEHGRAHTRNTVELIEQYTGRSFDVVEVLLRTVALELSTRDAAADARVARVIADNVRSAPHLRGVSVLDPSGGAVLHRYPASGRPSPAIEADAYASVRAGHNGRLIVGASLKDNAGEWLLGVTLLTPGASDAPPIMVVAHLDLTYLINTFRPAQIGRDGAVIVFRDDATVLARFPLGEGMLGARVHDTTLREHLARADSGTYEAVSPEDGVRRIISYRRSADLPLVTLVSLSRPEIVLGELLEGAARELLLVPLIIGLLASLATVLLRQIKRRENAETGERVQTELLRTTLENIEQGLMLIDADGRIRVCNHRAVELLGVSEELAAPGSSFGDLVRHQVRTGEYPATLDPYRQWELSGDIGSHTSYERERPNGTVLDVRTVPLPSGGVVRTFTDVTARRRAERAVQDSEARYRVLAENATDMIVRAAPDRTRLYVSPASYDLVGFSPEEVMAEEPGENVHPEDRERMEEDRRRLLGPNAPAQVATIYRVRHKSGAWVWVEARRRVVRNEQGEALEVISVVRDMTERQRQSDELRQAKETAERALEEARKSSEAKSEFLAAMSHEIRTPLHSIIGFTGILLEEEQPPAQRRKLEVIRGAGSALLTIVDDILDFSKLEAGQVELDPEPFDLRAMVESTVSMTSGVATAKELELTSTVDGAVPRFAVGDSDRIRQVLLNLLNNAVKFTEQGSVKLEVAPQPANPARVRFAVTDTGMGIPAQKRKRLFDRFSQGDSSIRRRFGGTGLGLAISKRLVEMMGGEIGFTSEVGGGSTFWFSIPLPAGEAVNAAPKADAIAEAVPGRVLLVEDVALNQEIARSVLERAGHVVDVATNGLEAVQAVRKRRYDVVLMDIQMPVMDGIAAAKRIRELPGSERDVPIIAMTANVLPDQVKGFLEAGMNDHIGKPFDPADLVGRVARWRAGSPVNFAAVELPAKDREPREEAAFDAPIYRELLHSLGSDRTSVLLTRIESQLTDPASDDVLRSEDRAAIGEHAHAIISGAGMLGFKQLSARSRALEDACRAGTGVEEALASFRASRAAAVERIDGLQEELQATARSFGVQAQG